MPGSLKDLEKLNGILDCLQLLFTQVGFLFCYGFYQGITDSYNENDYRGFSLINIISWLIAIAAVYGFYRILENKFKKENIKKPSLEIEEIGKTE